ncbi:hypothetical protein [Dactylosporangium sp. CS-033363]|uniref:hypothetical protein n=1 Tax=Dactylosporangium sp. CS-033363 TaxID=3239935 RepID=UPI003D9365DE
MARSTRTALQASWLDAVEIDAASGSVPGTGAGNGIDWVNSGREVAIVVNTSGAPITVTEVIGTTVAGAVPAAPTKSVAATTGISVLGPYPPGQYNDANGKMALDFSASASVKVVLVDVPRVA